MANYRRAATRAANRYGLDPAVFRRQIQQESGFNPRAVSPAGARGIAQIMPATARGWGVNPDNPIAALNAAAKHMAGYVHQFGSYADALRAYNAGPGNVRASHGFAETNNYVRTILGGSNPSARGVSPAGRGVTTGGGGGAGAQPALPGALNVAQLLSTLGGGANRPRPTITPPTAPAFSAGPTTPQGYQAIESAAPPERTDYAAALSALSQAAAQARSQTTSLATGGGGGGGGGVQIGSRTAAGARVPGELREMFWNGPGAVNVKDDRRVPKGFVSGHTDHVHVAGRQRAMVALGGLAQHMGLHVGENPRFGGVDPVHVSGSYHYGRKAGSRGQYNLRAIDVSGDTRLMRKFAHRVAQIYGV